MSNTQEKHMFINLVSGSPGFQAKAIRLGRKLLTAGWPVTLSVSLDAIPLLDPAAASADDPVSGKPLPKMLDAFMDEGGAVLAGRECLKLSGIHEEALPAGATVSDFEVLEDLLGWAGTKVITY